MTLATITKIGIARGYRPRRTYREVVCDWPGLAPEDDCDPLTATIRDDLTFDEIARIPFGADTKYTDLWAAIAPYVKAWNLVGEDADGNVVPLPAPAEAGPEIFGAAHKLIGQWLGSELKFGHLRGLEKKGSSTSDTPSGENASG